MTLNLCVLKLLKSNIIFYFFCLLIWLANLINSIAISYIFIDINNISDFYNSLKYYFLTFILFNHVIPLCLNNIYGIICSTISAQINKEFRKIQYARYDILLTKSKKLFPSNNFEQKLKSISSILILIIENGMPLFIDLIGTSFGCLYIIHMHSLYDKIAFILFIYIIQDYVVHFLQNKLDSKTNDIINLFYEKLNLAKVQRKNIGGDFMIVQELKEIKVKYISDWKQIFLIIKFISVITSIIENETILLIICFEKMIVLCELFIHFQYQYGIYKHTYYLYESIFSNLGHF